MVNGLQGEMKEEGFPAAADDRRAGVCLCVLSRAKAVPIAHSTCPLPWGT